MDALKLLIMLATGISKEGIKSIAIMSNDPTDYPKDSFETMIKFNTVSTAFAASSIHGHNVLS